MRYLFFLLGALLFATPTAYAQSHTEAPVRYDLTYDIYAGGVRGVSAQYDIKWSANSYELALKTATSGFIGKLFPWRGEYTTRGIIDPSNHLQPEKHTSTTVWRDNPTRKALYFKSGKIVKATRTEDENTETKNNIPAAYTQDALDLLTATQTAFDRITETATCNTSIAAFDGKRKFNITFSNPKKVFIEKSRYSVFSGPAVKCTITVVPVKGFSESDMDKGWLAVQNHTRDRGRLPEIWLGRVAKNGPLLPVRMEINSDYGAVIAHLSDFRTNSNATSN